MNREYALLALVTVGVAIVMTAATLPNEDGVMFWVITVAGYVALSVLSTTVLYKQERLSSLLTLRGGDLTLGIVSGLVLTGSALYALRYIAPLSAPRGAWLLTLYAQVGDLQADAKLTVGLLLIVMAEELVWRGLVLTHALELWGPRVAIVASSLLYALAHVPTAVTLAVPGLGYNPLLVLGAFAKGLAWGVMVWLTRRLAPAIVCHLVFSYFVAGPTPDWLF
jgi:uncharacterized protein